MSVLTDWKTKRNDKRVQNYWKAYLEKHGEINNYQKYQMEWNFIETEYSERPSNNGLDLGNPSFAYTTNLAKFIKYQ